MKPYSNLKPEDLVISDWQSTGVRIVHRPTGAMVMCDTDRIKQKNRVMAMEMLDAKVGTMKQFRPTPRVSEPADELNWPAGYAAWLRSTSGFPHDNDKRHQVDAFKAGVAFAITQQAAPEVPATVASDPEGKFALGMMSALHRMGASPAGLSLAAQLFGVGPCPTCGFRKLHCRCPIEATTASASGEACPDCGSKRPLHDLDCPVAVKAPIAVTLDEALYALDLVTNKMNIPGLTGQIGFAQDVLSRAGYNAAPTPK